MSYRRRILISLPSGRLADLEVSEPAYRGMLVAHRASVTTAATHLRDAALPVVWPTAAGTITISHPGASDNASGAGARAVTVAALVRVAGVQSLQTWVIPLGAGAATVDVEHPGDVLFVHDAWVSDAGSNGTNVADLQIDVGAVASGVVTIAPGIGRSRGGQIWVPDTHYLILGSLAASSVGAAAYVRTTWRTFSAADLAAGTYTSPGTWRARQELLVPASAVHHPVRVAEAIPPGSHVSIEARAASSTTTIAASIDWIMIDRYAVEATRQ